MTGEMDTTGETPVLLIRIKNTGPIISADLRAGLFAKYRKGTDRKSQSGMGLYFCRLACEAHGGAIALIDVPDFQTCFEIRLPSQRPKLETERVAALRRLEGAEVGRRAARAPEQVGLASVDGDAAIAQR